MRRVRLPARLLARRGGCQTGTRDAWRGVPRFGDVEDVVLSAMAYGGGDYMADPTLSELATRWIRRRGELEHEWALAIVDEVLGGRRTDVPA